MQTPISFHVEAEQYVRMKELADAEGISVGRWVRNLIDERLPSDRL